MERIIFTGSISVTKWSNLQKGTHITHTTEPQDNLLKSVVSNKSFNVSDKQFFYQLIKKFSKEGFGLNHSDSALLRTNNEVRIVPREPKLFDGEEVTVSFLG